MQTPTEVGQIWTSIYSVSLGTILAWIMVISVLVIAIVKTVRKILELLKEYQQRKEEYMHLQAMVLSHDEQMKKLNDLCEKIDNHFVDSQKLSLATLRHSIVRAGEDAMSKGEIKLSELRSLEELFEIYVNVYHQNSFVKTLVTKVRALPVVDGDG